MIKITITPDGRAYARKSRNPLDYIPRNNPKHTDTVFLFTMQAALLVFALAGYWVSSH
jgi:hypothetical protein